MPRFPMPGTDYLRVKSSVICSQKLARGYLSRKAISRWMLNEIPTEIPVAEERPETIHEGEYKEEENQSECSENSSHISTATMEIEIEQADEDIPSQPLCLDDSTKVLQRWFREVYKRQTAALLITKAIRTKNAIKRARLQLEEMKMKRECIAVTCIQKRVRVLCRRN